MVLVNFYVINSINSYDYEVFEAICYVYVLDIIYYVYVLNEVIVPVYVFDNLFSFKQVNFFRIRIRVANKTGFGWPKKT